MTTIKQLLGNRLLVQRIKSPTNFGLIHLPESAQDDANMGGPKEYRVLMVGPGRTVKGKVIPIEAEPGDRVICHSYTTGPVEIGDGTVVITEDQIIAVWPKPQNYEQQTRREEETGTVPA